MRDELCCGHSRLSRRFWAVIPCEGGARFQRSTLGLLESSFLESSLPPAGKLFLLLLCVILLPPSPEPSGMHTETMKNWLRSSKRRLISGLIRHLHHFCLEVPMIVVNKVLGYEERQIPGKS